MGVADDVLPPVSLVALVSKPLLVPLVMGVDDGKGIAEGWGLAGTLPPELGDIVPDADVPVELVAPEDVPTAPEVPVVEPPAAV